MQKSFLFLCLFLLSFFTANANCLQGNCLNGKGTYLYKDKSQYTGSFLHGKPHNKGVLKNSDGSIYEGAFENGYKHGYGTLKFASGDVYQGNFEKGVVSGIGMITYLNGDTYEGEWLNGNYSGKGKYTFGDGENYTGDFLDGTFTGSGKFVRKDGSYYDGEWFRNKKHGKGVTSDRKGKRIQYFEMDKLANESETPAENNFKNDHAKIISTNKETNCNLKYCHNEQGIYKYGDGSEYIGQFINGQGEGLGSCKYFNGNRYEGGWKDHAPHGRGTMYFSSGNRYSAIWENGKPKQRISDTVKIPASEIVRNSLPANQNVMTSKPNDTKVFALIVGVATYQHMPSLKYTDDDAYQLYAFLKSPEGGAIPDHQIKLMIDEGATLQTIKKELQYISSLADANDVILLYFSGHGIDGAYAPGDFDGYKNHLPYEDILAELNKSKAKHKLFIADACHSGSMIAARSPLNISMENFYNAYNAAESGTAILMSSKKDEVSLEYGGLRQGVFSHFLIKGLKGTADSNKDKLVTINELYQYISNQVKSYTNYAQTPSITGDYDKDMPVAMIR